ncbi:hypothetical protein [Rodentibacter ratti]|nr:hypothetical protein [Rodentibacter ratti]
MSFYLRLYLKSICMLSIMTAKTKSAVKNHRDFDRTFIDEG